MGSILIVMFVSLFFMVSPTHGYDPLDPNGNVTIKWDLLLSSSNMHTLQVTIKNMQLYRHMERPGWRLSWDWQGQEVIWNMWGAEATEQGNCSAFRGSSDLPHCCLRHPTIVDLLPGAPYTTQTTNCCRGGVLSSMTQDDSKCNSVFRMTAGAAGNYSDFVMPVNFVLGIPGYSCGNATAVAPSKFNQAQGRRKTQALATWDAVCVYSQFLSSPAPKCCVSLSAFYNETVVPCQRCSCSCQTLPGSHCVKQGETPPLLQQSHDPNVEVPAVVQCTRHMCPVRVHWHVKVSYREYWRVKITITNFNTMKNYSEWNLVVLHPNLRSIQQIFSFNYKPLQQHGYINDTGMFWGIQFYNDVLLQAGENGHVQTEMLLHKDTGIFTFREGWAFPRRILFNGDECVMPSPDDYPRLPNNAASSSVSFIALSFSLLLLLILQ